MFRLGRLGYDFYHAVAGILHANHQLCLGGLVDPEAPGSRVAHIGVYPTRT